jgi:hypothetical protein
MISRSPKKSFVGMTKSEYIELIQKEMDDCDGEAVKQKYVELIGKIHKFIDDPAKPVQISLYQFLDAEMKSEIRRSTEPLPKAPVVAVSSLEDKR